MEHVGTILSDKGLTFRYIVSRYSEERYMAIRDDATLLILTSLAGGAKHGYAMMEGIRSITGARIGPGTLYGAIARLEAEGLIDYLLSTDRLQPHPITPAR